MPFGDRLRFLREEAGLSQEDVAGSLRIDVSTVSHWENSKRRPSLPRAKRVAGLFGISMDFLVGEDRHHPTPIADLKAFLQAARDLQPEEASALVTFARYATTLKSELRTSADESAR